MTALAIKLLIGAGLGALWGRFCQCRSGACLLTANWKRGAIYGAGLGLFFHLASGGEYQPPKHLTPISAEAFEAEVLHAGRPVVVDFFATWCGPCKTLAPRLDTLAEEFGDRIKFVSLNFDEAQARAKEFSVEGIPTLLFFAPDGRLTDRVLGVLPTEALRAKLQNHSTNQWTGP